MPTEAEIQATVNNSAIHWEEGALRAPGQTVLPPVEVTGAHGGNAALQSLLAGLVSLGLITDSTV